MNVLVVVKVSKRVPGMGAPDQQRIVQHEYADDSSVKDWYRGRTNEIDAEWWRVYQPQRRCYESLLLVLQGERGRTDILSCCMPCDSPSAAYSPVEVCPYWAILRWCHLHVRHVRARDDEQVAVVC